MKFLANKIMMIANWSGHVTEYPAPTGSTLARCPDTTFLNSEVGFFPKVSLDAVLSDILKSSI